MGIRAVVYGLGLAYTNLEKSPPTLWKAGTPTLWKVVNYFWDLLSFAERECATQREEKQILRKIIVS